MASSNPKGLRSNTSETSFNFLDAMDNTAVLGLMKFAFVKVVKKVTNRFLIRALYEQTDIYMCKTIFDVYISLGILRDFCLV